MSAEILGAKARQEISAQKTTVASEKLSIDTLKEKREPSLGERNPLLTEPKLDRPETIDALKLVTLQMIGEYGGLPPTFMECVNVWDQNTKREYPRIVIRFETGALSEQKLKRLEALAKKLYGATSKTRKDSQGKSISPEIYTSYEMPKMDGQGRPIVDKKNMETKLGWYMGSNSTQLSGGHVGLFVFKDVIDPGMMYYVQEEPNKYFLRNNLLNPEGKTINTKYVVEIREGSSYQTDIVKFAIQVANILGKRETLDDGQLLYEVYNNLNRLGLKKTNKESIYGLDKQIERIERVLFRPLANLGLSQGINLRAESILLVGVPGTGKTLVSEYLLQKKGLGVFLVPVDTLELVQEMSASSDGRKILPRISQVFNETGIPVVLQLDDIEKIVQDEGDSTGLNSILLNLMAGVREHGFYVLASTNHPERINDQLLQPERFSHMIYFPLPDREARYQILDIHANKLSKILGKNLFTSDDEREAILRAIADVTTDYTPRYLADICTIAKSLLQERQARISNRSTGLTEDDLNEQFTLNDWIMGFLEADRRYYKKGIKEWDNTILKTVEKHGKEIRLGPNSYNSHMEQVLRERIEFYLATNNGPGE